MSGRSGSRDALSYPPFLGEDGIPSDPAAAAARIIPVPYDLTSTWRKGADRGPAALLQASATVELYDIETASEPWRRGIVTLPPILHDGGPEELAGLVRRAVGTVLAQGAIPVVIGGEHSVTIGAVEAAADAFPGVGVLQIDAHGDTRESYEGSTHNHACVMARAREQCPIVQVGIRAVDAAEVPALDPARVFWAHEIAARRGFDWMDEVVDLLPEHVYLTIDLDAFDPSLLPATGTPEPGGLGWYEVTGLVRRVARGRRIIGFDVVELLPLEGEHASEFTAAKLVHRVLAEVFAAR
ncbi:MAG: agmatinase [marine benthic group bacterium]|nr:agmatinase [Gemmatimonadota bacterium]